MRTHVPDARGGFDIDQLVFGVVVPEKLIPQPGGEKSEGPARLEVYFFEFDGIGGAHVLYCPVLPLEFTEKCQYRANSGQQTEGLILDTLLPLGYKIENL